MQDFGVDTATAVADAAAESTVAGSVLAAVEAVASSPSVWRAAPPLLNAAAPVAVGGAGAGGSSPDWLFSLALHAGGSVQIVRS